MMTKIKDAPKFLPKQCSKEEHSNILGFLKHCNPAYRFNEDAKSILGQMIHNLECGEEVPFRVGHGHTISATLKNKMKAGGLLRWEPGYHVKGRVFKHSTITATPLFFAAICRCCQLKHGGGHIGYWKDTDTLNELIEFNEFIGTFSFTHSLGAFSPMQRFNYLSADAGGDAIRQRLINEIHNIHRDLRPTVKIDGEDTVQYDVTATHPQILHNKYLNKPMGFDPYDIAPDHEHSKELRNAAKKAVMMMLNNTSRKSAAAALRKELRKHDNEHISIAVNRYVKQQIVILDRVYDRNPLLQQFFYKGMYKELMHIEGNIVWDCMKRLAAQNIPSATVHDELIAQRRHQQVALATFKECWIEGTGIQGRGISPLIKEKICPLDGESKA